MRYDIWFDRKVKSEFTDDTGIIFVTEREVDINGSEIFRFDHILSVRMAQKICEAEKSEKGEQAREYFRQIDNLQSSPTEIVKRLSVSKPYKPVPREF